MSVEDSENVKILLSSFAFAMASKQVRHEGCQKVVLERGKKKKKKRSRELKLSILPTLSFLPPRPAGLFRTPGQADLEAELLWRSFLLAYKVRVPDFYLWLLPAVRPSRAIIRKTEEIPYSKRRNRLPILHEPVRALYLKHLNWPEDRGLNRLEYPSFWHRCFLSMQISPYFPGSRD